MQAMSEPAVAEADRVEAFEDFFHANYERLLRTMYLSTGDRHEAEDLAQDAMARLFERWDRVRVLDDPVGYAYRTALNLRRSQLRRLATAAKKAFGGRTSHEPLDAVEERDSLRRALAELPATQREALILLDWLDWPDTRAATALGVSPGAVRTRASRARATLRDLLQEERDV
jgi:RNA polymerase sigma-70 factor (sigma-E family)